MSKCKCGVEGFLESCRWEKRCKGMLSAYWGNLVGFPDFGSFSEFVGSFGE